MEDILGSPALLHLTRIKIIELYNDNDPDNCSSLSGANRHQRRDGTTE
jgi:hypothetical protein